MSLCKESKSGKPYFSGSIIDQKLAIKLTTMLGYGVKGVGNVINI